MPARECPFCGKSISDLLRQCPFCREALPTGPAPPVIMPVHEKKRFPATGGRQIRRGLLCMLLAAVIQYFAGGYSGPIAMPVFVTPLITTYLTPLLFLAGLGLSFYGFYRHNRT